MARTEAEWTAALDGLETAITTAVTTESDQIKAEIQRLKDANQNPALDAQFDRVLGMQTAFAEKIGKVWEAEAPPTDPVDPPVDPVVQGRRR